MFFRIDKVIRVDYFAYLATLTTNIFNYDTFVWYFCIFNEIQVPEIEQRKFDYESKSGSCYYFTKRGMYRLSNHWGRLANSKWRLIPLSIETDKKFKWGFAPWTSFYPDNAVDELYFIQPDYLNNSVNYQHKNKMK